MPFVKKKSYVQKKKETRQRIAFRRSLMTEEEKEIIREKDRKRRKLRNILQTEEQREITRKQNQARAKYRRSLLTDEEREFIRQTNRERQALARSLQSEEEKERIRKKNRERQKLVRSKRKEERELQKSRERAAALVRGLKKMVNKHKVIKKEYNSDVNGVSYLRMTPVTSLGWIVQIEPATFITPDIEPWDVLGSDTLPRIKPDSSMMNQNINKALTCENYLIDNLQADFPIKIKKEPLDPDIYEKDNISTTVKQESDDFSEESSLPSDQGSLFQPQVMLKEEPI